MTHSPQFPRLASPPSRVALVACVLAAGGLTACERAPQAEPSREAAPITDGVFLETRFVAVPREALAQVPRMGAHALSTRPDFSFYSGGGAQVPLSDDFAYAPVLAEAALPSNEDTLDLASRSLRVGVRSQPRPAGGLEVRLESLPTYERKIALTRALEHERESAVFDTQIERDGKVLVVVVRAERVQGPDDLRRIYERKLSERASRQ